MANRARTISTIFFIVFPLSSLSRVERKVDASEHLLGGNQNNLAVLVADVGVVNAVVLDGVGDERLGAVKRGRVAGVGAELVDKSDSHFFIFLSLGNSLFPSL